MKKIRHLKALIIKLRARLLKLRESLIQNLRRVQNRRGVFQVRWGNLDGKRPDCATLEVEDLTSTLDANGYEVLPGCENERVDYNGSISVDRGILVVEKRILFEENDEVTLSKGSTISFNSVIAGHWDGLIIRYLPPTDVGTNQVEVTVTVTIGSLNLSGAYNEIVGRHDIGNAHQIEIHRAFRMLPGISASQQDELIDEKVNIEENVGLIKKRIQRIRLLKPRRPGFQSNVLDAQLDYMDELEDLADEAADYIYDELGSTQLQREINSLLTNFDENLSNSDIFDRIKKLRERIKAIRAATHQRKYENNLIPFKDTDDDQWYTQFVSVMKNKNIISGYKTAAGAPLGEYRPANLITIAEILKVALETAEQGQGEGNPDLEAALQHWAKGYVKMAEELGLDIVEGDVDLNRPATRAEVIRMILEALDIPVEEVTFSGFPDVPRSHNHARFVRLAKDLGVVSGDGTTGNFRPDDPVNRAEVAKIISKIIELFFDI